MSLDQLKTKENISSIYSFLSDIQENSIFQRVTSMGKLLARGNCKIKKKSRSQLKYSNVECGISGCIGGGGGCCRKAAAQKKRE